MGFENFFKKNFMSYITIFSKHYWPENFKINDISFKLKKKFKISVFTSEPGYNNNKIL